MSRAIAQKGAFTRITVLSISTVLALCLLLLTGAWCVAGVDEPEEPENLIAFPTAYLNVIQQFIEDATYLRFMPTGGSDPALAHANLANATDLLSMVTNLQAALHNNEFMGACICSGDECEQLLGNMHEELSLLEEQFNALVAYRQVVVTDESARNGSDPSLLASAASRAPVIDAGQMHQIEGSAEAALANFKKTWHSLAGQFDLKQIPLGPFTFSHIHGKAPADY